VEAQVDKTNVTVELKEHDFQATSKDGKEGGIVIIQPPPNSKPGDRVYFEGPEYEGIYEPS
jgi:hypothetical protein